MPLVSRYPCLAYESGLMYYLSSLFNAQSLQRPQTTKKHKERTAGDTIAFVSMIQTKGGTWAGVCHPIEGFAYSPYS